MRLVLAYSSQRVAAGPWRQEGVGVRAPLALDTERPEEEHTDYENLFNNRRDFP